MKKWQILSLVMLLGLFCSGNTFATEIVNVDFEEAPFWYSSHPKKLYWDSANGWFHAEVACSTKNGFLAHSQKFNTISATSFVFEFDMKPQAPKWGKYPCVGLFDESRTNPYRESALRITAHYSDAVNRKFNLVIIPGEGKRITNQSPRFDSKFWYHHSLTYNWEEKTLSWIITKKGSNLIFHSTILSNIHINDFNKILTGFGPIGKCYGTGWATFLLDNIILKINKLKKKKVLPETKSSEDDTNLAGDFGCPNDPHEFTNSMNNPYNLNLDQTPTIQTKNKVGLSLDDHMIWEGLGKAYLYVNHQMVENGLLNLNDLFLTYTKDNNQEVMDWPKDAVWIKYKLSFKSQHEDGSYHLYKPFVFNNRFGDGYEFFDANGAEIESDTKKIIVATHGFNQKSHKNPAKVGGYKELIDALNTRLEDGVYSEWKLFPYWWAADAATGPIFETDNLEFGATNGTQAAEIAHQQGHFLGELIHCRLKNIEKIHFIAHSAGTWAIRSAALYLSKNSNAKIQITILDPYIPGQVSLSKSDFKKIYIDNLHMNTSIELLENYYVHHVLVSGTNTNFDWGDETSVHINKALRVELLPTIFNAAAAHGEPLSWYASTVIDPDIDPNKPGGQGWKDGEVYGWGLSMAYKEAISQSP